MRTGGHTSGGIDMVALRTLAAVGALLALSATACGRAPVGISPSPSADPPAKSSPIATGSVDASPTSLSLATGSTSHSQSPATPPSTPPATSSPSPRTAPPASPTPSVSPSPSPVTAPPTSPSPSVSPSPSPLATPPTSPSPSASPSPPPLAISAPAFHAGEVKIAYADVVLAATGGVAPYAWSISAGALPDGLTLAAGGTLSGLPTAGGGFRFTVQVTDSAGATASTSGAIDIAQYLTSNATCVNACQVEAGCTSVCGTYDKPSGGVGPFKSSLVAGSLPPSTTLGWPALGGQFTLASTYSFTVTVYDSLGATTTVSAVFNVFAHLAFEVSQLPAAYANVAYSASIRYFGGSATPTVAVVKGSLPPGLGVRVDPQLHTVVISGVPTTTGAYSFYLRLTDTSPCGPGYYCSVTSPVLAINVLLG
jgi:large repetitive protein